MGLKLQQLIQQIEVGAGSRYLRVALGVIAWMALALTFNLLHYQNLSTPEGMDAAQLARNLAQGRGYTTEFIRPFSLYLLQSKTQNDRPEARPAPSAAQSVTSGTNSAPPEPSRGARSSPHPDLANPPVYPLLLAAVLKLMPFGFAPQLTAGQPPPEVHKPDLWIACFNQLLFLVSVGGVFALGARLFDQGVAWVTAIVFAGAELFWRLTTRGLPTLLLVAIFLSLVLVLVRLDQAARQTERSDTWFTTLAALAGFLAGVGGLTRYAFAWVIVPVLIFLSSVTGRRTGGLVLAAAAAFVLVVGPWVTRNVLVSGTPFGTAGYVIYEGTPPLPENELPRSINPDFSEVRGVHLWQKFLENTQQMVKDELPRFGGSWVSAFFLVGLLVPFRHPGIRRLRLFLAGCFGLFLVVQAATANLSHETGTVADSANLVVVLAPVVFLFGVSLVLTLVDETSFPFPPARYTAVGLFCLIVCSPLLLGFLRPAESALAYPPYFPPWIHQKAGRVAREETIMSDMPWAVAWYGQRPSVWLSLEYRSADTTPYRNDFAAVQARRPVSALYLSALSTKMLRGESLDDWRESEADLGLLADLRRRLVENWRSSDATAEEDFRWLAAFREGLFKNWQTKAVDNQSWEQFVVGAVIKQEVPSSFPLRRAWPADRLLPEIFLADSERRQEKGIQSE